MKFYKMRKNKHKRDEQKLRELKQNKQQAN